MKKPEGKEYILNDSICIKFQKMQTYLMWQRADQWLLGDGGLGIEMDRREKL